MNRKLNKYVNYLIENNPSPFCDYIISKELLKEDPAVIRTAYEWAAKFKLYAELQKDQLPDGSYGGWAVWNKPSDIKSPKDKWFVFWIRAVERLQNFSLFGEFMADKIEPYLYELCEKIVNDRNNKMDIVINNYFYHHGQYSDLRNTVQKKKNDLLLQIIRVLNKCGE